MAWFLQKSVVILILVDSMLVGFYFGNHAPVSDDSCGIIGSMLFCGTMLRQWQYVLDESFLVFFAGLSIFVFIWKYVDRNLHK